MIANVLSNNYLAWTVMEITLKSKVLRVLSVGPRLIQVLQKTAGQWNGFSGIADYSVSLLPAAGNQAGPLNGRPDGVMNGCLLFLSQYELVGMTAYGHQWRPIRYVVVVVASLARLQLPFKSSEQMLIVMFVWKQFRNELEKKPQSAVVTHTGVYTAIGALRHASVLSCAGFQH